MDRKELLQYLHVRFSNGDRKAILKDLASIIRHPPFDESWEQALLLMARIVDTNDKQVDCMELLLRHSPNNFLAQQKLQLIRKMQKENPGSSLAVDLDKKPQKTTRGLFRKKQVR